MIYIASIHGGLQETVAQMCRLSREVFQTEAKTLRTMFDPEAAFDSARQQYNSTTLLSCLLSELPHPDDKLIAITQTDLFIPVLTFVFGEAQLDGNVAVASSYRLRETFYGLPDNPNLTAERLGKEVIHELGHTYGLMHCDNYACAMQPSTGVEEIDLKDARFCSTCAQTLIGQNRESVG